MDIVGLRLFLVDQNKAGYATGDEKKWVKEVDGSTTIPFKQGKWRLHDNFFGGEPYGGRIVVFENNKACWMMMYYGWVVEREKIDKVYEVLRGALMNMPEDHPFRGPKEFKMGEYIYRNSWKGELDRYWGEEEIVRLIDEKVIYKANYFGGDVDREQEEQSA